MDVVHGTDTAKLMYQDNCNPVLQDASCVHWCVLSFLKYLLLRATSISFYSILGKKYARCVLRRQPPRRASHLKNIGNAKVCVNAKKLG
jgi:hypothetical protein